MPMRKAHAHASADNKTVRSPAPTLFAWLALDKGDNAPARFWAYVVAALREVRPDIGQAALAMLQTPQPASEASQADWLKTILTDLLNELALAGPAPLVLVLDDLYVIENSLVHDELAFWLEHLPLPAHLVVSSRADPPWLPARWRSRCQIKGSRHFSGLLD